MYFFFLKYPWYKINVDVLLFFLTQIVCEQNLSDIPPLNPGKTSYISPEKNHMIHIINCI